MNAIKAVFTFTISLLLSLIPLFAERNVSAAKRDALDRASDLAVMLEALATVEPVGFDTLPKNRRGQVIVMGGFVSMQHPEWPPLPGNLFNLDVWPLGEFNQPHFLFRLDCFFNFLFHTFQTGTDLKSFKFHAASPTSCAR